MTDITLYHNPRCSKSREALALLEERGIQATVVKYLDTPLNAQQISVLLSKLGLSARDIMRSGESVYKEMNLDNQSSMRASSLMPWYKHQFLSNVPS